MIPRHAPPFDLPGLLSVLFQSTDVGQAALEKLCADEFHVCETILLPSVRSGILLALRAVESVVETVVGPAYTCGVVHQAMRLSGIPVRFIDSERCGYLMDPGDLRKLAKGPSAIVLCETYGLRYSMHGADFGDDHLQGVRLWDMAMCVPHADDLCRLGTNDVALMSFGLGKCLYAGWGGLLLTQDSQLAARIRDLRDHSIGKITWATRLRHGMEVLVRTAAHVRFVYGIGRILADWRNRRTPCSRISESSVEAAPVPVVEGLSQEWTESMTPLNRKLARANLGGAPQNGELRRRQAVAYYRFLEPWGIVRGFDMESLPESHFPIRVAPNVRTELRQYLACRGIDTATYFPFPKSIQRTEYPNTAQASDEVVLLPLGSSIREGEIEVVAKHVIDGLRRITS